MINSELTFLPAKNEQDKELARNAQQTQRCHKLEDSISAKDAEIADLVAQVDLYRNIQRRLIDDNNALLSDIKSSNRHLDVVTVQHYELIETIERVNAEDEEIRHILKRKERVNNTVSKYQSNLKFSCEKLNSGLQSPVRTASTRDEN